ncbi:hypothetical protein KY343_00930 [Candidatus Woesearchaeota archaeon]|nr:hypothetical protein [Candidatus Woesearchaeota archaeon]
MEHHLTIGPDFFELQYEKLSVRCVQGMLGISLDELAKLYADDLIEFAPVKKENNRHFLAGMYIESPVDVTVDKYFDNRSSIVAASLDHDRSKEVVYDIAEKSGFYAAKPEQSFIGSMNQTMPLEIKTYEISKILEVAGASLEKWWGLYHYINLLIQYKGLPEDEATRKAVDRFGIDHSIFKKKV